MDLKATDGSGLKDAGIRFSPPFGIEEIKQILPHRPPFLLVDRIEEIVPDRHIVGYKFFTAAEPFHGGFRAIPPAIITEVMAQVGAILVLDKAEHCGKLIYFMGIEKLRFRRPVRPGSVLKLEADIIKVRARLGILRGIATVEGRTVAEGVMRFAL